MQCWLCGDKADSGEHIIKASDLKSELGNINQDEPIYAQTAERTNIRLNSLRKSQLLKFSKSLCSPCNNSRTQKFDKAWETLSDYLRNKTDISCTKKIKFSNVFKEKKNEKMRWVQLYFTKIFGCAILEESVPIELTGLGKSILADKACPNIFLTFGVSPFSLFDAGITDINLGERRNAKYAKHLQRHPS